jgi:molecular chaperone DnaK (HSP70)
VSGIFSPIIERGTPLPASREEVYVTSADNQIEVILKRVTDSLARG